MFFSYQLRIQASFLYLVWQLGVIFIIIYEYVWNLGNLGQFKENDE